MILPLLGLTLLACPPPGVEHKTAHYDLYAESVGAEDAGAMLEELHAHLSKYFGRAPKERLRIEVYATFEKFQEALKRDKVATVEAGGFYAPETRKGYLYVQPSEYWTRQLILHEATHQFHLLTSAGNTAPSAAWYTEGLAEYFGTHNWDGKKLETGVIAAATLEDFPAKALKQFGDLKEDLDGIAKGTVACDRSVGWALVHFLVNNHAVRWKSLAAQLDTRKNPEKAWEKSFGKTSPEFVKSFKDWLASHQQPLRIVWQSWQERGNAIEGKSQTGCGAMFRDAPSTIEAAIELKKGTLKAGFMFNFKSKDDYMTLQVTAERASVVKWDKGIWRQVSGAEIDKAVATPVASYRRDGEDAVLSVNGKEIGRLKAEGEVGLWLEACEVWFRLKK
ncbi:MAG: hypothetical protein FD180_1114 [Planctomycetota bacterium]|nr:MAG: hypothetical protein FD180_1114 [Planctomycetota bacterium]